MFNFIRTHQRIVQVVLLVLILPSFVLIGVSGYNSFVANDEALVEIDGNNLTSDDFDYALREQIATLQRQYGADFDPAV
ncbi:MAG TPA: SurA N-terminal domain-containing protein, partial [Candidatus Paenalcaligenes intestinipullorum]|nr:SurA N-terminal domain-containing protein [Candidatus Paenalcaligenes intestinipullorum]